MEEIVDDIGVGLVAEVIEIPQVGIVVEGGAAVTSPEFVAANVIEGFLLGAVLVDLPGEELVKGLGVGYATALPGFGEYFGAVVGQEQGAHRFITVVKRSIGTIAAGKVVCVCLLVALQVIPAAEDDPPKAIHRGREGTRRRVIQHEEITRGGIERPESGDRGSFLVFVELRVEMAAPIARAVAGEDDPVIRAVDGGDIVIVSRLVGDLGDDWGLAHAKIGYLKNLPIVLSIIILNLGCADDHAEDGLESIPVNARFPHGDTVGVLQAVVSVARGGGEIAESSVGVANVQRAAAGRGFEIAAMIAEDRGDRGEIVRLRGLGDEEDGVGEHRLRGHDFGPGGEGNE